MDSQLNLQEQRQLLKKFLVDLPKKHGFEFSDTARLDLRRGLFFAASFNGVYQQAFFDGLDDNQLDRWLPKTWKEVLYLEKVHIDATNVFYFSRSRDTNHYHPNRTCGRRIMKGEPVHRCATCIHDDAAGLCSFCFDPADHVGHELIITTCLRDSGGICDCGNSELWKEEKHKCKYQMVDETPEQDIPQDFKDALLQVIGIAMDYVVDVMSMHASASYSKRKGKSFSSIETILSSLAKDKYNGEDPLSDKEYILLYNDQNKQYREAVHRICEATGKPEAYGMMISDEVNKAGRAKVMKSHNHEELVKAEEILGSTDLPVCIRNARDVFREEFASEIVKWLLEISNGAVFGNYNIVRDTLSRALCSKWDCGVIPTENIDEIPGYLNFGQIPNIPSLTYESYSSPCDPNWMLSPVNWNIDQEIASNCGYKLDFALVAENSKGFFGSIFQNLLFFDIRLWKSLRTDLHNLFGTVLTTNSKYRSLAACQYMDIYPTLLELFLLYDKEPEYSCMTSLTCQILTPPTNATIIEQHGELTRILAAVHGYLTHVCIVKPCDVNPELTFLSPSAFKNRKIGQIFFDLCCILTKTKDYENILNSQFVNQICDILQLFQGHPTLKREALQHVQYESNDYGLYFNIFSVTALLSEMSAKQFTHCENVHQTDYLLHAALQRLLSLQNVENYTLANNLDNDIVQLNTEIINTIEGPQETIMFKVHTGKVSLLHPVNAFISWIIQYSGIKEINWIHFDPLSKKKLEIYLTEYPLRSIVLLAQIKNELWVRNGLSVRNQLHIYKTSAIRESGFKRDLYLLQVMAGNTDARFFLSSVFSRWALIPWLNEDFLNFHDYEEDKLLLMVEECLFFFIGLFSETSYLLPINNNFMEGKVIREIIHQLCFKPLSYSKLQSEMPDFLIHEKKFDLLLNRVADFIPLKGSETGAGCYSLKPEFMKEVNPYYFHYNSNKRDDAIKLVKQGMVKETGNEKEAYVKPILTPLQDTIFKDLFRPTSSKMFAQFLRSTLKFIDADNLAKTHTMLDFVLHLIHIAVDGHELSFSLKFCENLFSELSTTMDHNEPFYYESAASILWKFLENPIYDEHHAKIRAIFKTFKQKHIEVETILSEQVMNFNPQLLNFDDNAGGGETDVERKKRLAKERREKIMARFKKQQTKFVAENNKGSEDVDMADQLTSDDQEEELVDLTKCFKYPEENCILCKMSSEQDPHFGIVGNISQVNSARNIPFDNCYWTAKSFSEDNGMDDPSLIKSNGRLKEKFEQIEKNHVLGPVFPFESFESSEFKSVLTGCGHGMHFSCYEKYIRSAAPRQLQITKTVIEDFESKEFICPLCKSIGNTLIPIICDKNSTSFSKWTESAGSRWYEPFSQMQKSSKILKASVEELLNESGLELQTKLKQSYFGMVFNSQIAHEGSKKFCQLIADKARIAAKPYLKTPFDPLLANTISINEMAFRGLKSKDGLSSNNITSQNMLVLRSFIEFNRFFTIATAVQQDREPTKSRFDVKLGEELLARLSILSSSKIFEMFEDVDFFQYFISCWPLGSMKINSIYRLCYFFHLIQTLSVLLAQLRDGLFKGEIVSLFDIPTIEVDDGTKDSLMMILNQIRSNHPIFDNLSDEVFDDERFPKVLATIVIRSTLPFLRKLSILAIGNCGDLSGLDSFEECEALESDTLARYLRLPTIAETFGLITELGTIENMKFNQYIEFISTTNKELAFHSLEYNGIISLIRLPDRLDDIYTKILYPKNQYKTLFNFDPAVCLFCGEILNLQHQAQPGQRGECTHHYKKECLNDVGIFLLPKHGSLLLLNKSIGSFIPAPYVNPHGEHQTDQKNELVLRLSNHLYNEFIRKQWLLHDIPNVIARKLDQSVGDTGGWETL